MKTNKEIKKNLKSLRRTIKWLIAVHQDTDGVTLDQQLECIKHLLSTRELYFKIKYWERTRDYFI